MLCSVNFALGNSTQYSLILFTYTSTLIHTVVKCTFIFNILYYNVIHFTRTLWRYMYIPVIEMIRS